MMDMMNMGGGGSASMNMGGGAAGSMNMSGGMANGAPYGYVNGMANQMPGMADPNSYAGAKSGLLGLGGGLDLNSLLGGILNLAINIFVILLFVGLIVGVVVLIKKYLFDGEILAVKPKAVCARCGQTLRYDWIACPKCGEPKAVRVNTELVI